MKERIIVVGDTHGRGFWSFIKDKEKWTKFIFIGDYFDSFDISPEHQIENFRDIIRFKEKHPDKVVLLIGNHDEHYFPFMGDSGTSGYNTGAAPNYGHLLMTYKDLLQMAYSEGNMLFTHAGVGETWLEANLFEREGTIEDIRKDAHEIADVVNEVWKHKPLSFKFNGWEPTGDNIGQTPVWIRPRSLMRDSTNIIEAGITQVVGHTGVTKILLPTEDIRAKFIMIDALGTSGEYLIIEDGQFKTGKI